MTIQTIMLAPAGFSGELVAQSGNIYIPNAQGFIAVNQGDEGDALKAGFIPLGQGSQSAYSADNATSGKTLSAAEISGGSDVVLNMSGALTGAANAQLPTVAALIAAISNIAIGQTYRLRIINSSSGAYAWTVTTNTGWTLNGTMSIAQNTWRDFIVTLTSAAAATLQSIGTGTNS